MTTETAQSVAQIIPAALSKMQPPLGEMKPCAEIELPDPAGCREPSPQGQTWCERWLRLDASVPGAESLIQAVQGWCKDAARNRADGPRIMVLVGKTGIGKTHSLRGAKRYIDAVRLAAWERDFWKTIPSTHFLDWSLVASLNRLEYPMVWEDQTAADILFVDDVGSEIDQYRSGAPTVNLAALLNDREHRWTAISTNIKASAWATYWDKRVEDRLYRHSRIVDLSAAQSYFHKTDNTKKA